MKKEKLLEVLEHLKRDSCELLQWNEKNNQAYNQIVALVKKEVTEEWIIEMAEKTATDYPDVAFPNLITIFKGLLTEAGVSIAGRRREK